MKIGITERGDPSLDFAWVDKINKMDGTILITKNLTDKVINSAVPYFDKLIFHISCTGYGQTIVEPNIPEYTKQLSQAQRLVESGFPIERIVIRIDPIVPTEKGLATATKVFEAAYNRGFKRFRVSLVDCYPHVRDRMIAAGLTPPYGSNGFTPTKTLIDNANRTINMWKKSHDDIWVESCAEHGLTSTEQIGCISEKDLTLLGLVTDKVDNTGYQRSGCMCCSAKTELLSKKERCPYQCMYCYWK